MSASDEKLTLLDCNTHGAMTLGLRAAGFRPILAHWPTEGHAADYLLNNSAAGSDVSLKALRTRSVPNVFRVLPEVDFSVILRPRTPLLKRPRGSAKAPSKRKLWKSFVRLRTSDYRSAKAEDIREGAFLIGTMGDMVDGLRHRNIFRDKFREITADVDCLTMQADSIKPKNRWQPNSVVECAAFIDLVQTVKPKVALAIEPFMFSLPLQAGMDPVIRHYDDFIRSWLALRYVVVPLVYDATVFGASVSRPQCAVLGVRNDVFNAWMRSDAFTDDDAVLWKEAALRAKYLQSNGSCHKMIPFSDVWGWIAGNPETDDYPPFPLTPHNATGTVFECAVFRKERGEAERTTYRSAVDRNLIVEPFWDESMGDVFTESDRREAALELSDDPEDQGEWIGADGFCDTGTDMENAGGVLMHCADVGAASGSYGWLDLLEARSERPGDDGGACGASGYEMGAERDRALSSALVKPASSAAEIVRPTLKTVVESLRGINPDICDLWMKAGIGRVTERHIRKWLFFRLLNRLPANIRRMQMPIAAYPVLPEFGRQLEHYRTAIRDLLTAQLEFSEENGRFTGLSGSAAERFAVGGTLLVYRDERITRLVLELRQAVEDVESFDEHRASLCLRTRYYIQPADAPIRYMPLLHACMKLWHPDLPRPLSSTEIAVCQGYPKEYRFVGAKPWHFFEKTHERAITMYDEVIHTVSPLTAYAFGKVMKRILTAANEVGEPGK